MNEKKMDALDKFESCRLNDGLWCYKYRRKFLGRVFRLRHDVGINGLSIICHCENCKSYEPKGDK